MATSYPGNVTPLGPTTPEIAAAPIVRTIGLSDLHTALRLGWEDFKAVPRHAIILCVIYPLLGFVLARTVLGYAVLPLLFPLAAGFALLGPFAPIGLYDLPRRRVRGDRPLSVRRCSQNFPFISQFAEIPDEVVFAVEYSVRAAQMTVHELRGIDRKIPTITPARKIAANAARGVHHGVQVTLGRRRFH